MAAAAILKNLKWLYFGRSLTDFDEIWHDDAVRPSRPQKTVKNFKFLKIQDGGGRHLEKSKNSHISAVV